MSLKFNKNNEELEKQLFYIEVERLDLLESTGDIPEELEERFIKKRSGLVKKIKDFRRSQNTKLMWNRHRFKMLKGVRKWHRSLSGKKFHRQLGRFLASKITDSLKENYDEKYEVLKALSSLKTHLFIEAEYFRNTAEDDADFEVCLEYIVPLISSLELKLLESKFDEITYDEIEAVFRTIDEEEVVSSLSEKLGKSEEELHLSLKTYGINEDLTYGMTVKYYKLLGKDIGPLKEFMKINEV